MICPICNKQSNYYTEKIIKSSEGHLILYSCPNCGSLIKEKPTKYGLGIRIIFLILAIPTGVATMVFIIVLSSYFAYIILFLAIAIFFAIKIMKIKKSKEELAEIQLKSQKNSKEGDFSSVKNKSIDPLMGEIRKNAEKIIKDGNAPSNKKNVFKIFRDVVIVVIVLIPVLLSFYNKYNKLKQNDNEIKNQIIENKANLIINSLQFYKQYKGKYPVKLDSNLYDTNMILTEDMEKDYFGKSIEMSDFSYVSDGQKFKLCIDIKNVKKCWNND